MKLLLFADLHLDARFPSDGPARRRALRDALGRIVDLAQESDADAVLCAGDLYEQDRCSPATAAFLRSAFDCSLPVFLAPGNDDRYGPQSVYRQVDWTPNVHVFSAEALTPVELTDGVTLWGAANVGPGPARDLLDGFAVNRGGVNLALYHGSAPADVAITGLDHAFLGHVHTPEHAGRHTYPGNPAPLTPGETGERGAVLCTVYDDGTVSREVFDVSRSLGWRESEAALSLPDLNSLTAERTVRGQFVRDVLADTSLDPAVRDRVLSAGLRALEER
ncbi:DNA repair exonuclease SbcCD nuclease subunit [Lentzea xinjiangensis]|uniref:DNA repair exonuclease SbcCD nuclease subunit n=1 Tax=Lentzea xinjiangensis TaxID=402600 RepID=A0A1H9N4L5_9PSEU|nr:metallophosphoesterase [Lentzea xinjiangensis]SER30761.1 DNA repair exonuclease SbcCD nuclease subunit [Lentzea xinjiangensis]